MSRRRFALWASTRPDGAGGVAAYVRLMRQSALWRDWDIRQVSTHRSGTTAQKVLEFAWGSAQFVWVLVVDRPVVVHVHMASFGSFYRKSALVWVATVFRVPVIVHVHGSYFDQFYDGSNRLVRAAVTATLHRAAVVIALGAGWSRALARIAPRARVVVVPNPARVTGPAVRQPAAGEAVHVVYLSDVTVEKGAFTLLDAWPLVLAGAGAGPLPRLTIAGRGEVALARARSAELAGGVRVGVVGHLDPAAAQALLRTAQVLVLPSRFEGQPMAILEAMANGLCVVATPVGGIPEMLDESCGILVPPADPAALAAALIAVVTDHGRRAELGAAARSRVLERLELDVVARRLDELYREVAR